MNAIRIQIHLKYFFDDDSSKQFYNFWYAFEPSNLLTIKDILDDIRLNYLKNQISSVVEENDERAFIIHLDDCQLLPFTSSQVLRDNDRLILMPLTKYKLHKKSLQDSINLNLSSSISIEPPPPTTIVTVSEKNDKRQRIESIEQNIPTEATITVTTPIENVDEQPYKKKTKTKSIKDQVLLPPVTQPISEPSIVQPTLEILKVPIIEKEINSEAPLSLPSTNGHIRELKSKTPTWKAQPPVAKGNSEDKMHIRFDSDSDEEPLSQMEIIVEVKETIEPLPQTQTIIEVNETVEPLSQIQTITEVNEIVEPLPHVNGSNSSVRILYVPTPVSSDVIKKPNKTKNNQKTIDLLFEMKQHKSPDEKQGKKIQQQFGKKRALHKKRALGYFSMANFVDQAFGLEKDDLEKQTSSNGYHTSPSSPQTLPTSFNKLARLPLVAEAIENNDKIYDLYPPITQCPSVQTRIAFKLLELSEDFCPNLSTFKEGTVIDVNQTTNELTIQLDKPLQTAFDQPSKFYAPPDDVLQEEEELTTVILPFSDLNSVRLLSTSNENTAS